METGFNPTNAISISVTIVATELAVLALFPAISQIISEQRKVDTFSGFSSARRFNLVIYVNLAALAVSAAVLILNFLAIFGVYLSEKVLILALLVSCVTFVILAAVLATVVSIQVVRK